MMIHIKDNYDLMESQVYFMLNRLRAIIAVAKIYIQENYDRKINGVSDALQEELLSMAADNIMLLENGMITATGKHDELLESSEGYKELYETQFSKVIEYEKDKMQKNID